MLATLALVGFSLGLVYVFLTSRYKTASWPPGPPTLSWFGSVELPKSHAWHTYTEWRKIYGDIIYISAFGNPIVILNSAQAAKELLENRGVKYASRPFRTMLLELMGWNWLFSTLPYGPQWRKHRSMFHQHFHANNVAQYRPIQLQEAYTFLRNLLVSPDQLSYHLRRSAAAAVLDVTYGYKVDSERDEYVKLADEALATVSGTGIFGSYLVDYIPSLKYIPSWMPGAGFKRKAHEWKKLSLSLVNDPFEMVKRRWSLGTANPCIVATELENRLKGAKSIEEEEVIRNISGTVFAAGADTTVAALLTFFLTMTLHPEIQRKAQAEIDSVIGQGRLPDFSDRQSLPYVEWIIWECLRWNPVTPLSLAHCSIEDDTYNGYSIGKNTTIFANVWGIFHDENIYPDPFTFNPERFSDPKKNAELGINEIPLAAFGFGRRICPGRWFAINSIWITAATVLSAYNILPPLDEEGKPFMPSTQYTSSLISRPVDTRCRIVPRSKAVAALIAQTKE